jgi:O-antigen/teichoic acid export membrane protein
VKKEKLSRVSQEILFEEAASLLVADGQGLKISSQDIYALAREPKARPSRVATALQGGTWSLIGYVSTQLLRTLATLFLARHFLGPEPFGLVGLVGVFIAGLAMFSELGIVANVVQHPRGDDLQFLNTAFSIQAGRGLAIWMIAALAAYPVAVFYRQPVILPLLVVAATSELVRGLTSTAAWTLTRHVNLRGITLLTIASEVVAFGVAIFWAALVPSAWALVGRTVVAAAVYAIGSHFISRPRVRFGWDRSSARDILHFGGWISLSTAAYFLGCQGERLVLGKFVTAAELGCFSLALMVSSVPAGGVNQLVSQIFLPMISKSVRTSRGEAMHDYRNARRLFFALGLVAALGFLALGKPFVGVVLTSKYGMAGWMLQVLGLRVALDLFAAPVSSLILAYGKSRYSAAANTTRLVIMGGGILAAFHWFGLPEAMVVLIAAQAISYLPLISGLKKLLPEVARAEIRWYAVFVALLGLAAALPWPGIK